MRLLKTLAIPPRTPGAETVGDAQQAGRILVEDGLSENRPPGPGLD
jgi:hypothetical protein